jgi:hypothetical protein
MADRIANIVLLLLGLAAFLVPVVGGPLWGYPVAFLLGLIATAFVGAYPSDRSLRKTLAAFGAFLVLGGVTHLTQHGIRLYALRESAFTLLFGSACLWSAAFPAVEQTDHEERPN